MSNKKWHEVIQGLSISVAIITEKENPPTLNGFNLNDLFPIPGQIKQKNVTKYHIPLNEVECGYFFRNPIKNADTTCIGITFRVHKSVVSKMLLSRKNEGYQPFDIKIPQHGHYGYVQLLYWPTEQSSFPKKFEPVRISCFGSIGINYLIQKGTGKVFINN